MPASFTSWTTDGAWRGFSPSPALVALAVPGTALAWTWPVDGPVLRPFLFDRTQPELPGQHRGIDIAGAAGAPVVSPTDGVVTFAGTPPGNGLTLSIRTPDGYSVTLTHLGSLEVRRGASVEEGAIVARVGASGPPEVDEPYVHLGIRLASDEDGYLDPLSFLPPRPAASPPAPPAPPADGPGCRHGAAAWRDAGACRSRAGPGAARRGAGRSGSASVVGLSELADCRPSVGSAG